MPTILGPYMRGALLRGWLVADERLAIVIVIDADEPDVEPVIQAAPGIARELLGQEAMASSETFLVVLQARRGDDEQWQVVSRAAGTLTLDLEQAGARSEEIVQRALALMHVTQVVSTPHGDVTIEREPTEGGEDVRVTLPESDISLHIFKPDGVELPPAETFIEERVQLASQDAKAYLMEIPDLVRDSKWLLAFRAFHYHRVLADYGDPDHREALRGMGLGPEITTGIGLELAKLLLDEQEPDLAEWVARSVAELAEQDNLPELAREAWRTAAICHEALCDAGEAEDCYARCLAHHAPEARIRMSAGITAVMMLAHVELEELDREPSAALCETMAVAEAHLQAARAAYAALDDEGAAWSLVAIDLDLIRLRDLVGDHTGALRALDELERSDRWVEDEPLRVTAIQYRLAILGKQARSGVRDDVEAYVRFVTQVHARYGHTDPDFGGSARAVVYLTILGDVMASVAWYGPAMEAFLSAFGQQLAAIGHGVRVPGPGLRRGGWLAIDTVSRLLRVAYLSRAEETEHRAGLLAGTFLLADNVKGHYFKRDLAFQLTEDPEASALAAAQLRDIRAGLVSRRLDPRILVADYEHTVRTRGLESAQSFGTAIQEPFADSELLDRLFEQLPDGTKLLSLYAGRRYSWAHVFDVGASALSLDPLPAGIDALDRASAAVQAYFSGRGLYGPIDPGEPGRHDKKFLAPLAAVGEGLAPLRDRLAGAELIIVAPHRSWHSIPIHALLLPALWELGGDPGVLYTPSFELLARVYRRAEQRGPAQRGATLFTAPAERDPVERFRTAHDTLEGTLYEAAGRVGSAFGEDVEADTILSAAPAAGVQHLLAHGLFRAGDDALDSGLTFGGDLTAPRAALSAADVLAAGAAARHVTVQACSLGASVPSDGDEFWGFSRALIASGSDAVLTPLWNIDLESSTWLLQRFYEGWLGRGLPRWRALADAQREMAMGSDVPAWRHPYHWAAFELVGNGL